jgi:hypothetical protein
VSTAWSSDLLTAVGSLQGAQPGESLRLVGRWSSHPKFGRQFEVDTYSTVLPATIQGIQRYLGSGLVKGIGPVFAERIVDRFGLDTLEVIENAPQRLPDPERWRAQPGTARHAVLIRQIDVHGDLVSIAGKIRQHELRPPEHAEGVTSDGSPGEVEEPLALLALHRWAAEVPVVGVNLRDPLGRDRIGRDETDRLAPHLEPDVDVRVGTTGQSRQPMAADEQAHGAKDRSGPDALICRWLCCSRSMTGGY